MEANREKQFAVIHAYGYAQSTRHADLLAIYKTFEEANSSLDMWRKAREESKEQLKRFEQPPQRRKAYVDRLVIFDYFVDSIKNNSEIPKLYLRKILHG